MAIDFNSHPSGYAIYIFKNGSEYAGFGSPLQGTPTYESIMVCGDVYLETGQYIDIRVFQASGYTIYYIGGSPYCYCSIHKVC